MKSIVLVIICFASMMATASAGVTQKPKESPCANAESTVEMGACGQYAYGYADRLLNKTYKQLKDSLDAEGRVLLRNAQRAWVNFRDAECLHERDLARGGTMAGLLQLGCLESMTSERTAELETYKAGLEAPLDDVYWQQAGISERFNCAEWATARVGLVPGFNPDKGQQEMKAVVQVGKESLEFPIGGEDQSALCAAPVGIEVLYAKDQCPAVRLDDGMCDAFVIRWDRAAEKYVWERN